jgi:D-serine deaminase-like pyridoxal phosphate-dependent protein
VDVPCPTGGAGFQTYVKVPLPPVDVNTMLPSHVFEQVGGVSAGVTAIGGGAGTVKAMVVSQPSASVTVSE